MKFHLIILEKKVSIVVKHDDHYRIITKGALEEVLKKL